jgi:hypothetical protein
MATKRRNAMLRELNENEMEMVSGGTSDCLIVNGDPTCPDNGNTETPYGPLQEPEQGGFYYNGNMYPSQEAADIARIGDGRLTDAYGDNTDSDFDQISRVQVDFGDVSGVDAVDTGTPIISSGDATIGISDVYSGNPRITGSIPTQ